MNDVIESPNDEQWMRYAMTLAARAEDAGEVPVGAVIVKNSLIVGEGWNQPISATDPTAHAEIIALRMASQAANNYRLPGCTLYVTLEPCTMCVGALVHSRIERLVYGTTEPKAGAVESQAVLLTSPYFNHRIDYVGGVLASECQHQLSHFFQQRRKQLKALKQQNKNAVKDDGING
jgi:tRNA(adenine34) deaminase